jgi:chaperonin GroES
MKIRPLHDAVIVKRQEEERKTASGIVIPDAAAKKPLQAEVIYVGPGKLDNNGKQIAMSVKPGDKVLIANEWSGKEFKFEGQDYLKLSEEEIIGVIEA